MALDNLMRDARARAERYGHMLTPFARRTESSSGREWAHATCELCGAAVTVVTHDTPAAIGAAVVRVCP